MNSRSVILGCVIGMLSACARHQPPNAEVHVAASAPVDKPIALTDSSSRDRVNAAMLPCSRKAMALFGAVRQRYTRGLPPQQTLFVVTRLQDAERHRETVFVAVDSMAKRLVFGRIWNPLRAVQGYRFRQALALEEKDIVDWMISKPDGSEEGNLLGKFLDKMQAENRLPTELCTP